MPAFTFDTLAYAKEMEAAGFTQQQAEAFACAQGKILKDALATTAFATKSDIQDVCNDIQALRTELKNDNIQALRFEMKSMEIRLLKWQVGIAVGLGSFMLAGFGTLAAVIGWLGF